MPTYRNDLPYGVVYEGKQIMPGDEFAADYYVPHMTVTGPAPLVVNQHVLYSADAVTDTTIELSDLPACPPKIQISVMGAATAYFADDTNGVDCSSGYVLSGAWKRIGRVRIAGTAQVVIERWD
jgi:hypothetical protein